MKELYERRAHQKGIAASPSHPDWTQQWVYLSLWYATLYVVAEGWCESKFVDEDLERLLTDSAKVEALRRFRNGAFHFQKQYFDSRLVEFVAQGPASAEWDRQLHSSFGRWFLAQIEQSQH